MLMLQSIPHHLLKTETLKWYECVMTACGTGSLLFFDVTSDGHSRINYEMYRDILSVQVHSNAAKLLR